MPKPHEDINAALQEIRAARTLMDERLDTWERLLTEDRLPKVAVEHVDAMVANIKWALAYVVESWGLNTEGDLTMPSDDNYDQLGD